MTFAKITSFILLFIFINHHAEAAMSDHFVTTWKTDNPGSSNDTSIKIFTSNFYEYLYDVDWDNDGVFDEVNITGDITHDFGESGFKTIRIRGKFPQILLETDHDKIISIDQWGGISWKSMSSSFQNAKFLVNKAKDTPDLSECSSLRTMFANSKSIGSENDTGNWHWETSNIVSMSNMFNRATGFNKYIGSWDTSNVNDMSFMFSRSPSFDQNIGNWNTGNVRNMRGMFKLALSFNQYIGQWNTSNVESMWSMFEGAKSFNQDIGDWNTSKVEFMRSMFSKAAAFNQNIGKWNTESVSRMDRMFAFANNFDQDLSGWNIENVLRAPGFLKNVHLSIQNYESILIKWSQQNLQANLNFDAGHSFYCSINAQKARDLIRTLFNWKIKDKGQCPDQLSIVSNKRLFADENQSFVGKVKVIDRGLDNITFEIFGGEDDSLFTVNPTSGEISFVNPPDYENPLDYDADNYYQLIIKAIDDSSDQETVFQNLTIYVSNVNENLTNDHLVTTWKTDISPIAFNNRSITIPTQSSAGTGLPSYRYSYNVDWDNDGIFDEFNITGNVSHFYDEPGIKTIRISGIFPKFAFSSSSVNSQKIIAIEQWGTIPFESLSGSFFGAQNVVNKARDIPNLNDAESEMSLSGMFSGARLIGGDEDTGNWNWDTTYVESLDFMFKNASVFNKNISLWNVSNVDDLSSTFQNAMAFNQDLSFWDTSHVESMAEAFENAHSFDQDLSMWIVESVEDFEEMFNGIRLSTTKYEKLLVSWANQELYENKMFHGGNSVYCSEESILAHQSLTNNFGWHIEDAGECGEYINIISDDYVFVNENQTFVSTVEATEPNSSEIRYSIELDDDGSLFTIDSINGQLNFLVPPDFEQPKDVDADNIYHVTVRASSNNTNQTDVQTIEVHLVNVHENLPSDDFVITWRTYESDDVSDSSIRFNIYGVYDIDWNNDGVFDEIGVSESFINHDFGSPGIYTIRIRGNLSRFINGSLGLLSVDQWGTSQWDSFNSAFKGSSELLIKASDTPDLSQTTSLENMFENAIQVGGEFDTGNWNWDTRHIEKMSGMFRNAQSFNKDISSWNTSSVATMGALFSQAESFNQDISFWDISNVTSLGSMFAQAKSFNQNLTNWDTSNVNFLDSMFRGARAFNGDISKWDVSNVTSMNYMFNGAVSFNQDINEWNTSNVTDMEAIFAGAFSFNQKLDDWDVSQVDDMTNMFAHAYAFNQDISHWDTSKVRKMIGMFLNAGDFDQNLANLNIESVIQINDMLRNTNLSVDNYESLLVGWSKQEVNSGLIFDVGDIIYCSQASEDAHDILTSKYKWRIIDGGLCPSELTFITKEVIFIDEEENLGIKFEAFNEDFNQVNYQIAGGDDHHRFSIDSEQGVLLFNQMPDYENAIDHNADNKYQIQITATDMTNTIQTVTKPFTIVVRNVPENLPNDHFVTTWKTDNLGFTNDSSILISPRSSALFDIDWDNDGVFDDINVRGNIIHEYITPGEKTIRISGEFAGFEFGTNINQYTDDGLKLISIDQWGSYPWTSMFAAFRNARNLRNHASDIPNLKNAFDISYIFFRALSIGGSEQANWHWDTAKIRNMRHAFNGAESFNKNIGNWDVSNVADMQFMFSGAKSFNQPIDHWQTKRVTDMSYMFDEASFFNANLNRWDVGSVDNMRDMFANTFSFNQNLADWNTSRVANMESMFSDAISFNQDISGWDVENVIYFNSMFDNVSLSVENYDKLLIGWKSQNIRSNRRFDAGSSIFCSTEAQMAHEYLSTDLNWNITDGGVCDPHLSIVSDLKLQIEENHSIVTKILTTDPDFDTPTFMISGGVNQDSFNIDPITGVLSFINPPDYENPQGMNSGNSYEVEITAVDDGIPQEIATEIFTVNVIDLTETVPVNLNIDISANAEFVNAGDTIQFTITVTNTGDQNVVNTMIFDVLPVEVANSSWTCEATGQAMCSVSGYSELSDFVSIANDGSSVQYVVTTTFISELSNSTMTYQVFVEATEPQYDTDLSNNNVNISLLSDFINANGFE